jgi:hypothetical protein
LGAYIGSSSAAPATTAIRAPRRSAARTASRSAFSDVEFSRVVPPGMTMSGDRSSITRGGATASVVRGPFIRLASDEA